MDHSPDNNRILSLDRKKQAFVIPVGYLETLPGKVSQRIARQQPNRFARYTSWLHPVSWGMAVATVLFLLFLVVPFQSANESAIDEALFLEEHLLIEQLVEHRIRERSSTEDDEYIQVILESQLSNDDIFTYF